MKVYRVSLAISLTVALLAALILKVAGAELKDVISTSIPLVMTIFVGIFDVVKKFLTDLPSFKKEETNLEKYNKNTLKIFIYSFMASLFIINFAIIISTIVANITGLKGQNATVQSSMLVVFVLPVLYFIGKWMGRNSEKNVILLPLLVAIASRLPNIVLDYTILSDAAYKNVYGIEKSLLTMSLAYLIAVAITAILLYIGYWIGKKRRSEAELNHLFSNVSPDDRFTLIQMAKEVIKGNTATPESDSGSKQSGIYMVN